MISFLGNFYRHLAIFYWSHWFESNRLIRETIIWSIVPCKWKKIIYLEKKTFHCAIFTTPWIPPLMSSDFVWPWKILTELICFGRPNLLYHILNRTVDSYSLVFWPKTCLINTSLYNQRAHHFFNFFHLSITILPRVYCPSVGLVIILDESLENLSSAEQG